MIWFLDSSAVVKRYAHEEGSRVVLEHVDGVPERVTVVAGIARVEVPATLWAKHRMGHLEHADVIPLVTEFEDDWNGVGDEEPSYVPVPMSPHLLGEAARIAGVHGLRSLDAIQLACALESRRAVPECDTFLTFDHALAAAASREGLSVPGL